MNQQEEDIPMNEVRIPFPNPIQNRFKLFVGPRDLEAGNGRHYYVITADEDPHPVLELHFQHGALKEPESQVNGVLTTCLLAALVDHLQSFQDGPFSSLETAAMIEHLQNAQNWAARRQDDRGARGVQGKHAK